MNVKEAIKVIENRLNKANETAAKYLGKVNEMEYLLNESNLENDKKERWRLEVNKDYYFNRFVNAEEYAEETRELIKTLKTMEYDEKVVFVNEERLEEKYILCEGSNTWSNNVATIIELEDLKNDSKILYICMLKKLGR